MAESPPSNMWLEELQAVVRGAVGGFLFGIPLLYTVEVWSIGSMVNAPWLLAVLAVTFVVVLLLTQIEGFRYTLVLRPMEAVMESVEAMGIGVICAALALVLLRRITLATPLSEALGKLVFEGVPFSLGVALAQSTVGAKRWRDRRRWGDSPALLVVQRFNLHDTLVDLDATLLGAVLIAFSIAPTEEIPILASTIPPLWLLLIISASLIISYAIVFVAGFRDHTNRNERGLSLNPLTETLAAYLVALLASVTMLVFFQQLNWHDPWQEWLNDTIVLGLPASIGGAAGRLLT